LAQWFLRRRFLCEFPIGSYVKLSSAVGPSWSRGRTTGHIFGREPFNDYFIKILKKGGWNFKKIFSSETTEPISIKLCWNDPWVFPFQNCVRHFIPPTKMATTAELNLT
jgi:hypothetical protein